MYLYNVNAYIEKLRIKSVIRLSGLICEILSIYFSKSFHYIVV